MPRGTTNHEEVESQIPVSAYLKITDEPVDLYFEGLGEVNPNGRFGAEIPLFVVNEEMEAKEVTLPVAAYRKFKEANIEQWQKFTISKKLEKMTNPDGTQRYADDGKEMSRNVWEVTGSTQKLTAEQVRTFQAKSEQEIDIDDIPF